jgi:hypothetical protein
MVNARGETPSGAALGRPQPRPGDHSSRRPLRSSRRTGSSSAPSWSPALGASNSRLHQDYNDEDFDELVEEFAPYANAIVQVSSSENIISHVFDDED